MDHETLGDALDLLSSADHARVKGRHVHTLRGVRGVPDGEVARIAASAWLDDPPAWPAERVELSRLFMAAHEDGLVAVALAGALVPDDPAGLLELGLSWLPATDDVATADALGPVLLGPAALAADRWEALLEAGRAAARPAARRAVAVAALAALPEPLAGPAAAALRERVGARAVQIVAAPLGEAVAATLSAFVRDSAPEVQKGLRRVLRAWGKADLNAATSWATTFPGGIPKPLRAELPGAPASRRSR